MTKIRTNDYQFRFLKYVVCIEIDEKEYVLSYYSQRNYINTLQKREHDILNYFYDKEGNKTEYKIFERHEDKVKGNLYYFTEIKDNDYYSTSADKDYFSALNIVKHLMCQEYPKIYIRGYRYSEPKTIGEPMYLEGVFEKVDKIRPKLFFVIKEKRDPKRDLIYHELYMLDYIMERKGNEVIFHKNDINGNAFCFTVQTGGGIVLTKCSQDEMHNALDEMLKKYPLMDYELEQYMIEYRISLNKRQGVILSSSIAHRMFDGLGLDMDLINDIVERKCEYISMRPFRIVENNEGE